MGPQKDWPQAFYLMGLFIQPMLSKHLACPQLPDSSEDLQVNEKGLS